MNFLMVRCGFCRTVAQLHVRIVRNRLFTRAWTCRKCREQWGVVYVAGVVDRVWLDFPRDGKRANATDVLLAWVNARAAIRAQVKDAGEPGTSSLRMRIGANLLRSAPRFRYTADRASPVPTERIR